MKAYPPEERAVNLDFDFVYRRALPNFLMGSWELFSEISGLVKIPIQKRVSRIEKLQQILSFLKMNWSENQEIPLKVLCGRLYCWLFT